MNRFRVLCADPPWRHGDQLGRRGGDAHYKNTLSMREIMGFRLPPMLDNSWLFLWRVTPMPLEALQVMRAWGFTYKTEIVWRKLTPTGKPHFGMGRYVRGSHETCLVGVRGRVHPAVNTVRSVIEAAVGRHSEKPEAFYDLVEELTGRGPYAELFARRHRPGWSCFGNELPGKGARK